MVGRGLEDGPQSEVIRAILLEDRPQSEVNRAIWLGGSPCCCLYLCTQPVQDELHPVVELRTLKRQ